MCFCNFGLWEGSGMNLKLSTLNLIWKGWAVMMMALSPSNLKRHVWGVRDPPPSLPTQSILQYRPSTYLACTPEPEIYILYARRLPQKTPIKVRLYFFTKKMFERWKRTSESVEGPERFETWNLDTENHAMHGSMPAPSTHFYLWFSAHDVLSPIDWSWKLSVRIPNWKSAHATAVENNCQRITKRRICLS